MRSIQVSPNGWIRRQRFLLVNTLKSIRTVRSWEWEGDGIVVVAVGSAVGHSLSVVAGAEVQLVWPPVSVEAVFQYDCVRT